MAARLWRGVSLRTANIFGAIGSSAKVMASCAFHQPYAVFSPDASRYVTWMSVPGDYRVGFWDVKTGYEVASHYVGGIIDSASFRPTISPRGT